MILLIVVCWSEDFGVLQILIRFKVDVNLFDGYNILFIVVCYKGNVDVFWMLIKVGVNVN